MSASAGRPVRRRASRAAGPAGTGTSTASPDAAGSVALAPPPTVKVRPVRPAGPPPRRPANRRLVALVSMLTLVVVAAARVGASPTATVRRGHPLCEQQPQIESADEDSARQAGKETRRRGE